LILRGRRSSAYAATSGPPYVDRGFTRTPTQGQDREERRRLQSSCGMSMNRRHTEAFKDSATIEQPNFATKE